MTCRVSISGCFEIEELSERLVNCTTNLAGVGYIDFNASWMVEKAVCIRFENYDGE